MSTTPSPQRVEQTLRRLAQLRTLFRRLPRVLSPRERRAVDAFASFVAGREAGCSFEALEAGFRDALRHRDAVSILRAVERSGDWILEDPTLHPYYYWAKAFARESAGALRPAELPGE